ncbi:MAG: hypothetical protein HOQ35_09580 [Acidobacteriaceae bacterium]|nr:hypothetical protein [Acidobacteriaceae bacterium]
MIQTENTETGGEAKPPMEGAAGDIQSAIHRLLASSTFASAPRLRTVLSYLATALESGTITDVTEQSIGQAVFGRPAGYNASEDNIVRVTVRHLRNRLDEFYRTEGRDEKFVLEIPKGKYIPILTVRKGNETPVGHWGETAQKLLPADSEKPLAKAHNVIGMAEVPNSSAEIRSGGRGDVSKRYWIASATVLGIWAFGLICGMFWRFQGSSSAKPASTSLLALLGDGKSPVVVVVTDSNLQAYREIFGKQVALKDYIARSYGPDVADGNPRIANAARFAMQSNETNVSSAIVAADVKSALASRAVVIKQPHDMSMREFQDQEDLILLGGPWINPWGQLFENRLTFRLLPMAGNPSQSQIHDYGSRPGDQTDFPPHNEGNLSVNYVRVAVLPNFSGSGRVVLVGATSPEALEAAGTFLSSHEVVPGILKDFHAKSVQDLPSFELVLEVKGLNAVPGSWRVIAERLVHH